MPPVATKLTQSPWFWKTPKDCQPPSVHDFAELALVRYPHRPLGDRVWELRHNLTACDATFVALAETLAVPLVTCVARRRLGSGPSRAHRALRAIAQPFVA